MKDYRAINTQLSGMSRNQLEKIYKDYAKNINKRLKTIRKSGKFAKTIKQREKIIKNYLTNSGNVSKAVKKKDDRELKVGILDLGYFLSLKTTSITGLKKKEKKYREFFLDSNEYKSIDETNIDLFLDFLETSAYEELEEVYSSDVIFEEFQGIEDFKKLNLSQLERAFNIWSSKDNKKTINDILKGMIGIEDN